MFYQLEHQINQMKTSYWLPCDEYSDFTSTFQNNDPDEENSRQEGKYTSRHFKAPRI